MPASIPKRQRVRLILNARSQDGTPTWHWDDLVVLSSMPLMLAWSQTRRLSHSRRAKNNMAGVQSNQILASLSNDQLRRLAPHLHSISLPAGKGLYEPGEVINHAYFLDSGLASETVVTGDGIGLEVFVTGNEGVIGIPALLKYPSQTTRCTMQVDGLARRILADQFSDEFLKNGLYHLFHRYLQSRFAQMSRLAFCSHSHSLEERLARWLATAGDCTGLSRFKITQESLALLLGVNRSSLTTVAGELQRGGLIECHRGSIAITNRRRLEGACCECYSILRRDRTNLLAVNKE